MKQSPVKKGILLAAFGAAGPLGECALASFARQARSMFPGIPVRWAYTSDRMRSRLAAAGKKTDSVKKALCRMGFERYTHVAVQSLHLIPGIEYEALLEETRQACLDGGPRCIEVGHPLLHDASDVTLAAKGLLAHLPGERRADEVVVCMGHGTWHTGAASYEALALQVREQDPLVFIGTLSGEHSIDSLIPSITDVYSEKNVDDGSVPHAEQLGKTVWLLPLLSIIGRHAQKDMAGENDDSWRSRIQAAGFACTPVMKGTVEYEGFARIWLAHLSEALKVLPE